MFSHTLRPTLLVIVCENVSLFEEVFLLNEIDKRRVKNEVI